MGDFMMSAQRHTAALYHATVLRAKPVLANVCMPRAHSVPKATAAAGELADHSYLASLRFLAFTYLFTCVCVGDGGGEGSVCVCVWGGGGVEEIYLPINVGFTEVVPTE